MLCLFVGANNTKAATPPQLDGVTFYSSDGETLDFYADKVIYHAEGMSISRRGDWECSYISGVGNTNYKWAITVRIYVGNRTVTMTGYIESYQNGRLKGNLILDGKKWTR